MMYDSGIRECPLAGALAVHLRSKCHILTSRWLERIVARVSILPDRVFPSQDLLDHVPLLIIGIADFLENPANELATDMPVIAKAMELGELRYNQGFDAYEILKEYEILGGILFNDLTEAVDQMAEPCEKGELLACGHRLFQAVTVIQQTTTMHYLHLADKTIGDREGRLRAFNRAVSHELKNQIGAILGASDLLRDLELQEEARGQFIEIIGRQARSMKASVDNLIELSRLSRDSRMHRHVRLPEAVAEACRQVRNAAQAAGVNIRIEALPDVEVKAAAVELCLANYLSNAIKYADADKAERVVTVGGSIEQTSAGDELIVRVRDNGLGVPEESRAQLFEMFFRAHDQTITGAEGTGLGLSIVRETIETLGGRAWAEFPGGGTTFAFSLPLRRAALS